MILLYFRVRQSIEQYFIGLTVRAKIKAKGSERELQQRNHRVVEYSRVGGRERDKLHMEGRGRMPWIMITAVIQGTTAISLPTLI